MEDTILLWEIYSKQDPTLRDIWRTGFYFEVKYGGHNPSVRDLEQTGS